MKKFFKQKNKEKGFTRTPKFGVTPKGGGFTLVETLVAISIFTLSILSLMSVLANGISNTTYAKNKIIAGYLAQEGIEYVRNMRDTYVLYPVNGTWNSFVTKISVCNSSNNCGFDISVFPNDIFLCSAHINQCKLYIANGDYNTKSNGVDSGFVRTITASITNPNEIKITSDVSWRQGSGTYHANFSENLFNWIQ